MLCFRMFTVALLATPALAAQEGQSLADQLPANTLFYFEIPEVAAVRDGLESAALGRIWHDQATQAFLGDVVEMGMAQYMEGMSGAAEMGMPVQFMSWESMKSIEFGFAMQASDSPDAPSMFAGLQVEFADGLAEMAFGMASGAMQAQMEVDLAEGANGSTLRAELGPQAPTIVLTRSGNQLTLQMSMNMVAQGTLASSESFQRSRAKILQPGVACFGFYNPRAALEMQSAYMNFGTGDSDFASMADALTALSESAMGNAHSMSFGSGWSNGQSVTHSYIDFDGKPAGWAYGATNADRDLLKYIPADSTSFSIAGLANQSNSAEIFAGLDGILNDPAVKENIAIWEQAEPISHSWMVGANRPLLDAAMAGIGTRMFSYSTPTGSRSFMELTDPAAVQAALTPLMKTVAQLIDSVDELPIALRARRESPRNDPSVSVPIYYLRLKAEELPPQFQQVSMFLGSVEPAFAVSPEGWMIMSMSRSEVRGVVRSGLKASDVNITSNVDAAAFLGRAPEQAMKISWSDPRPGVTSTMNLLQTFSGLAAMQMDASQMPVDLTKIPTAASINAHLRPSESYTWMQDGSMMSYSSGSFGFGDLLGLAGYALPGAAMAAMYIPRSMDAPVLEMQPTPPPPVLKSDDPKLNTQIELARLQTGILVYEIIHEKSPASLAALLEAGPEGEAYIDQPERGIKTDGWGNSFIYRLDGESFILYSTGPDGVDQGGAGDDVSVGG